MAMSDIIQAILQIMPAPAGMRLAFIPYDDPDGEVQYVKADFLALLKLDDGTTDVRAMYVDEHNTYADPSILGNFVAVCTDDSEPDKSVVMFKRKMMRQREADRITKLVEPL